MNFGKSFICLIAVLFLFNVRGHSQPPGEYKYLYNNAERLSGAANPTGQTDKAALNSYLRVIHILTTVKKDDPFLFKAYVSTSAFLQVLGRQNESINFFKQALALKKRLPELKDSALFRPIVYCGNAYYSTDKPDTAETLYKEAESIAEKYPGISELERLYNTLGVVSYSKGNYAQSIIYYQKAISTLR